MKNVLLLLVLKSWMFMFSGAQPLRVPSSSFPTLSAATNAAVDGDIIHLWMHAIYDQNNCNSLVKAKNVTIMGQGAWDTIVDCGSSGVNAIQVTSDGASFQLLNLGIRNGQTSCQGGACNNNNLDVGSGAGVSIIANNILSVTIFNCSFVNNTAVGGGRGGGLFVHIRAPNSIIKISNSAFIDNVASGSTNGGNGGGLSIYFEKSADGARLIEERNDYTTNACDVIGCVGGSASIEIDGNAAAFNYSVTSNKYQNSHAKGLGGGGLALTVKGSCTNCRISLENSTFSGNSGLIGAGSNLFFFGAANGTAITVKDCVYWNNSAGLGGGANVKIVGTVTSSSIYVIGGSFFSNLAKGGIGGGFFLDIESNVESSRVVFSGGSFISNLAFKSDRGGGGVAAYFVGGITNSRLLFENGTYMNNAAYSGGGGIVSFFTGIVANTTIEVKDGHFTGNTANELGGGGANMFFKDAVTNSTVVISGCSFLKNLATSGGGGLGIGFIAPVMGLFLMVSNSIFVENIAAAGGGGGYFLKYDQDTVNSQTIVESTLFASNAAIQGGGGVFILFVRGEAAGCSVSINNATAVNNTGESGGGGAVVEFHDFVSNSVIVVDGGYFENNVATTYGGGATVAYFHFDAVNCSVQVRGGTYINNTATKIAGGGASMVEFWGTSDKCSVSVTEGNYLRNSASYGGQGGALLIFFYDNSTDSTVNIIDGQFANNSARLGGQGGGICIQFWSVATNANINIDGSTFSSNTAPTGGGMSIMFFEQQQSTAQLQLTNSVFEYNVATGLGGGLLLLLPKGQPLSTECSECTLEPNGVALPPSNPICKFPPDTSLCSPFLFSNKSYIQNSFVPISQKAFLHSENVSFVGNAADCNGCMGGASFISNGKVLTTNVTYLGNRASQEAGAVYTSGTAEIVFYGKSLFVHNTAATRTSVVVESRGRVTFSPDSDVTFFETTPINFTIAQGSFSPITVTNTGLIVYYGRYNVFCPPGFKFSSWSVASLSLLLDGWRNPMLSYSAGATCVPCGSGYYSVRGGGYSVIDNEIYIKDAECSQCPFGADCSQGMNVVLASKDYWGFVSPDLNSWNFTRCPLGYCCQDSRIGCIPYVVNMWQLIRPQGPTSPTCANGRDPSVPLCGACLPNHSQNLRGQECSRDEDCNDGSWALPVLLLGAIAYSILLLWTSTETAPKDKEKNSRDWPRFKTIRNIVWMLDVSWVLPTLLFFFQNISFLYTAEGHWPKHIIAIITALTNLHLNGQDSSWSKICAIRGLTTEAYYVVQLLVPVCIAVVLLGMFGMLKALEAVERLPRKLAKLPDRFGPAGVQTAMICYTLIVSVCGTLLHCVDMQGMGGVKVLFQAGGVTCLTNWQKGLLAVFAVVVIPFPFLLFGTQVWIRKKGRQSHVMRIIEYPYHENRWYWPPVVLLRRLCIALVYSLEPDQASQGMWFCVLFIFFLIVQLLMAPHRSRSGDVVETVGLTVLTVTSLCVLRSGSYFEAAVNLDDAPAAQALTNLLDILQTILFFIPMSVALALIIWDGGKLQFGWSGKPAFRIMKRGSEMMMLSSKEGIELSTLSNLSSSNNNDNSFLTARVQQLLDSERKHLASMEEMKRELTKLKSELAASHNSNDGKTEE